MNLLITGCTTLAPYTLAEKTSTATKGATIGAAAGAFLGYVTGDDDRRDRQKRILIGAGPGALTGAAIGNCMDRQEAELRKRHPMRRQHHSRHARQGRLRSRGAGQRRLRGAELGLPGP